MVTDYDGGYPIQNTYGPPKDYFYDEKPEYYQSYHGGGSGGHHQDPHETVYHHHHGGGGGHHGELAKNALLWPLAGITLLGAFAVLMNNPILLHLGTIGRRRRRRRRRQAEIDDGTITAETIKTLLDKVQSKCC